MNEPMMHKLPTRAYTSQEWFDLEQELIFSRTWRYAGFREDISEPGQYITVQAGKNNIFIVMGRDHRLRAFHNICRHRGTQLIRAVGKTQTALTCPYHDWTYNLEGELVSIPDEQTEYGREVDKSCLGLKPASVDVWRGMLFVHPDPGAGSIMEWFAGVEERLGPHNVDEMPEYEEARISYEIKANWKIVVDNYIDIYHLSHLHSNTLNMYDHSRAQYTWRGPHYLFWEPLADHYRINLEANTLTPLVIPVERAGAWVPMLFPGVGLAESESSWSTFIITPLAPDLTRIENRTRLANASSWEFAKQSLRSGSFWSQNTSGKYPAESSSIPDDPMTSGDFTAEDIYACEQQQKALYSPLFEAGPPARGEQPVLDHQQVVIDWMEARQ